MYKYKDARSTLRVMSSTPPRILISLALTLRRVTMAKVAEEAQLRRVLAVRRLRGDTGILQRGTSNFQESVHLSNGE